MNDKAGRSQRGFASVLIVGMSTVLLLFLGISIDWGIILRYRRAMYNACDSGALAGALNLRSTPTTAVEVGERYARNDMTQNNIQWDLRDQNGDGRADGVIATPLDNAINQQATASPPWNALRVEIRHDVPTYLFRLVRDFVTVRVRCMARVVNIIPDDLTPLGLDYCLWAPLYRDPNAANSLPARCTQPPYAQNPPDPECYNWTSVFPFSARPEPCQSFDITVAPNSPDGFGSGNTGLLNFCPPNDFGCAGGGANEWNNYFCYTYCDNPPPPPPQVAPYCFDATSPPTGPRTDPVADYAPCANVLTKPGVSLGQVRQGVTDRCANPDQDAQFLKLILLNPAFQDDGNGRYEVEIWGFAIFQIDCSSPMQGQSIRGGFVSIVSGRITGRETDLDTGAFTIKLAE